MIPLFFILSSFVHPKCDTLSLTEEIQQSALIGVVEMIGVRDKYTIYIKVNRFFKGRGYTDLRLDPWDMYMEEGKQYLIFARKDDEYGNHYIPDCSRSIELEKSSKEILSYLNKHLGNTLCFDPVQKQKNRKSVCPRIYTPVCGCNGFTYDNECEAIKSGIMKYTHGECK